MHLERMAIVQGWGDTRAALHRWKQASSPAAVPVASDRVVAGEVFYSKPGQVLIRPGVGQVLGVS